MKKIGENTGKRTVFQIIVMHVLIFSAAALIVFIMLTRFNGCVIRTLTSVPCPGCGLTRAWFSALRLDFARAVYYYPLFWLPPPLIFAAIHRDTRMLSWVNPRAMDIFLISGTALILLVYLIRLIFFRIP